MLYAVTLVLAWALGLHTAVKINMFYIIKSVQHDRTNNVLYFNEFVSL